MSNNIIQKIKCQRHQQISALTKRLCQCLYKYKTCIQHLSSTCESVMVCLQLFPQGPLPLQKQMKQRHMVKIQLNHGQQVYMYAVMNSVDRCTTLHMHDHACMQYAWLIICHDQKKEMETRVPLTCLCSCWHRKLLKIFLNIIIYR